MRSNFNPRPREGGRHENLNDSLYQIDISIHAPARGGDAVQPESREATGISIHAPARGGDLFNAVTDAIAQLISIHAPARGGDLMHTMPEPPAKISIHAPARGGDVAALFQRNHLGISIHAPARGGDSKDAQFYLRIFDKQVELLRFWGKMRGGCLRNPEKDRRFLGKSLANLPEISGHLDFAGA